MPEILFTENRHLRTIGVEKPLCERVKNEQIMEKLKNKKVSFSVDSFIKCELCEALSEWLFEQGVVK